jgi:hypothetical protein
MPFNISIEGSVRGGLLSVIVFQIIPTQLFKATLIYRIFRAGVETPYLSCINIYLM